jgi:hypothetical protein
MLQTLSLLVHAESKAGKSTLGATCPPPMLIFDAEGSTKFIPIRKVEWNPIQGPPPVWDGTWDACLVIVRDFNVLLMAYQWLVAGQHNFRSLVMDSISEIQRKLKTTLVGTEQMKMQDWGELLTKMDSLIRGFRDLTLHQTNPIQVAMFIAETRLGGKGKYEPYMQGQISIALPYWMDLVGYLNVVPWIDTTTGQQFVDHRNEPAFRRELIVGPSTQYLTGERVQGRLPNTIENPNVWSMLLQVYPELNTQAQGAPT